MSNSMDALELLISTIRIVDIDNCAEIVDIDNCE